MTDLCRVFLVGNITHDLARRRSDDGTLYGATTLCVVQTELVGGVWWSQCQAQSLGQFSVWAPPVTL